MFVSSGNPRVPESVRVCSPVRFAILWELFGRRGIDTPGSGAGGVEKRGDGFAAADHPLDGGRNDPLQAQG